MDKFPLKNRRLDIGSLGAIYIINTFVLSDILNNSYITLEKSLFKRDHLSLVVSSIIYLKDVQLNQKF